MTTPEPTGGAVGPPPVQYDYVGGNPELDQLLALEGTLYDQHKDTERRLNEVKDRIKVALTTITRTVPATAEAPAHQAPFERYRIAIPNSVARVLRWKNSRKFATQSFKARYPDLYEEYAPLKGTWYLEREGKVT